MNKLSLQQFQKARTFILESARPLEQALFRYEFENGKKDEVLFHLAKFQNEDGGFGHGLEPDFRTPYSSSLATTVALQLLSTLKVSSHDKMVQKAISYLLNSVKIIPSLHWEIVPPEVELAPRAVWWNYDANRAFSGNPNAEILGFFFEYRETVPHEMLDQLAISIFRYIDKLEQCEFHELLCFLRLYDRLPKGMQLQIEPKLLLFLQQCVETDEHKWHQYCLQPHQVAPTNSSPFHYLYAEILNTNLGYIVSQQTEQGNWNPPWGWGQYEEDWLKAKVEWQGVITLDNLRLFKRYNWFN